MKYLEKGQSSKKAKGRRKVAIAAMKGLAAMKVDEVFEILNNQLKKKGMVRIQLFVITFLTVSSNDKNN